jgi:hypothetical protein
MNILPTTFVFDQFEFHQLAREGDVALFEKSKPGQKFRTYEVVIIQRHRSTKLPSRIYCEREAMPRSEDWGILGWSLCDLPSALAKFRQIVDSRPSQPKGIAA